MGIRLSGNLVPAPTAGREGTFRFTLDEDVELARRLKARTFRDALDSVPRYRA